MTKRTPIGTARDELTHHIWINTNASDEEVKEKIKATLGWSNMVDIQYLYAQGKNLRMAKLSDVEHGESWDLETLRVLMGSGALYVLKENSHSSSSSVTSDDDDTKDFLVS